MKEMLVLWRSNDTSDTSRFLKLSPARDLAKAWYIDHNCAVFAEGEEPAELREICTPEPVTAEEIAEWGG